MEGLGVPELVRPRLSTRITAKELNVGTITMFQRMMDAPTIRSSWLKNKWSSWTVRLIPHIWHRVTWLSPEMKTAIKKRRFFMFPIFKARILKMIPGMFRTVATLSNKVNSYKFPVRLDLSLEFVISVATLIRWSRLHNIQVPSFRCKTPRDRFKLIGAFFSTCSYRRRQKNKWGIWRPRQS